MGFGHQVGLPENHEGILFFCRRGASDLGGKPSREVLVNTPARAWRTAPNVRSRPTAPMAILTGMWRDIGAV